MLGLNMARPIMFVETEDSFLDTPPSFNRRFKKYSKWKRIVEVWQHVTDVPKSEQGKLLALSLDDETLDTLMQVVTIPDIMSVDGATKVLRQLDIMFHDTSQISTKLTQGLKRNSEDSLITNHQELYKPADYA